MSTLALFTPAQLNDILFVSAGFAGLIGHYIKKKAKGETDATFVGWFTHNNPSASLYTVGAFAFAMIAALNTGVITDTSTLLNVIYAGIVTGFAIDSGFNNDTKPAV